jgi:hypothetical protein
MLSGMTATFLRVWGKYAAMLHTTCQYAPQQATPTSFVYASAIKNTLVMLMLPVTVFGSH